MVHISNIASSPDPSIAAIVPLLNFLVLGHFYLLQVLSRIEKYSMLSRTASSISTGTLKGKKGCGQGKSRWRRAGLDHSEWLRKLLKKGE